MEPRWMMLAIRARCLACRRYCLKGAWVYSLTGSKEDIYCITCGLGAEHAMKRHAEHKERERRIIAGLPV